MIIDLTKTGNVSLVYLCRVLKAGKDKQVKQGKTAEQKDEGKHEETAAAGETLKQAA